MRTGESFEESSKQREGSGESGRGTRTYSFDPFRRRSDVLRMSVVHSTASYWLWSLSRCITLSLSFYRSFRPITVRRLRRTNAPHAYVFFQFVGCRRPPRASDHESVTYDTCICFLSRFQIVRGRSDVPETCTRVH